MSSIVYEENLSLGSDIGQGLRASLGTFTVLFGFFARGGFLLGLEFLDTA